MVSDAVSDFTALFKTNFRWHARTVFIARFIFLFRPSWPVCWLVCRKCPGALFFLQPHRFGGLYHHLHSDWIFFGKKRKQLEAWVGPAALYLIFAGIIFMILGVIFRLSLSKNQVKRRWPH